MDWTHWLAKIPGVKACYRKLSGTDIIWKLQYENLVLAQEMIQLRLRQKADRGERFTVLFVCHRPALWENLRPVYETLKADPRFETRIVAIPQKSRKKYVGYRHEDYESMGAEDFFVGEGCVNAYDYEHKQWLDLRSLRPDYVFFQQPYNVMRPTEYTSGAVSKYAKILYMAYFPIINLDDTYDEATPLDFMKDLSFCFVQHEAERLRVEGRLTQAGPHVCQVPITGFPRFELIDQYRESACDIWDRADSYKMLWTPRWTTSDGNCHFFAYKDKLLQYCEEHPEVELTFRPHPQAFLEWKATGEMKESEQEICRQRFSSGNRHLDESMNYYPVLFSSDVLITDRSTMFVDFLFTEKPIIYCASHGVHDEVIGGMEKVMYWVQSWEELLDRLNKLRAGDDPLREARISLARDYRESGGRTPSERIRDLILSDARGWHPEIDPSEGGTHD